MPLSLPAYRQEVRQELDRILQYWQTYSPDNQNGGFYGRVGLDNQPDPTAAKAIVLNSRICWTFSAAYRLYKKKEHLALAKRAYDYIYAYFRDPDYGGVYWEVKADGSPLVTKKQLYGNAFAIYGLSEYYRASGDKAALDFAISLWKLAEKYAFDPARGGYIEAFERDWSGTTEYILCRGDRRKSMNTHLHLIEAFTNLYRVWKDKTLHKQIVGMLETAFEKHIIDPKTYRMHLFLGEDWSVKSEEISYGHDIEASWLLVETAETLEDKPLLERIKKLSINMAKAAADGIAPDKGMNYEYNPITKQLNTERSWWVMTEAMVGFLNAYQLTGKVHFLEKSTHAWEFTKQYLLDYKGGEWRTGVTAEHTPIGNSTISAWKCPYHNARACMEVMRRLG
ncbi:MAG: AGE family epimerase/isomerase [Spirosomataceae bacterium]